MYEVNIGAIIAGASNIRSGENPSFTSGDFLSVYPQFGTDTIPALVLDMYIEYALSVVQQARFRSTWKLAICYFVAHYCTLWLRTSASQSDGKEAVVSAGNTAGIITSESVDGVSYSMDVSGLNEDLKGFGSFKTTDFGASFATLAKAHGKGGMVVP